MFIFLLYFSGGGNKDTVYTEIFLGVGLGNVNSFGRNWSLCK